MRRTLSALCQAVADWLDPARANIRKALRDADTMQAIQREAEDVLFEARTLRTSPPNVAPFRAMGDEVNKMLAERDAEIRAELDEARGKRPTRFVRKLRVAK